MKIDHATDNSVVNHVVAFPDNYFRSVIFIILIFTHAAIGLMSVTPGALAFVF